MLKRHLLDRLHAFIASLLLQDIKTHTQGKQLPRSDV